MNEEFADVIGWLRSPEGERWSHEQMPTTGLYHDPGDSYPYVQGFFSLKPDDTEPYSESMWWGDLPGDQQLAAEAARGESAHAV